MLKLTADLELKIVADHLPLIWWTWLNPVSILLAKLLAILEKFTHAMQHSPIAYTNPEHCTSEDR